MTWALDVELFDGGGTIAVFLVGSVEGRGTGVAEEELRKWLGGQTYVLGTNPPCNNIIRTTPFHIYCLGEQETQEIQCFQKSKTEKKVSLKKKQEQATSSKILGDVFSV